MPHLLFRQTSTRPSFGRVPPISLILPSLQAIMCACAVHMERCTYSQFSRVYMCVKLVVLTCGTSHTGIFTMASWTEVISPNSLTGKPWTVDKSCLSPSTQQVIKKDGASATAKVSIGVCYCTCGCTVKASSQCTLNLELLVYWDMLSIKRVSVCTYSQTYKNIMYVYCIKAPSH